MATLDFFSHYLDRATMAGERSTVLRSLSLIIGLILTAIVTGTSFGTMPMWVAILLFVILFFVIGLLAWAFVYFSKNNPDALRSEKFTLAKMAISKKVVLGDDQAGLKELGKFEDSAMKSLPPTLDALGHSE